MDDRKADILKNSHAMFMRRACDKNYGSQSDRIRAMDEANNAADEFFALTGRPIEDSAAQEPPY